MVQIGACTLGVVDSAPNRIKAWIVDSSQIFTCANKLHCLEYKVILGVQR
jgi:hypothetical protein